MNSKHYADSEDRSPAPIDGRGALVCPKCGSLEINVESGMGLRATCLACKHIGGAHTFRSEDHPAPAPGHPDDTAVDRFSDAMKRKLGQKRQEGRGGWEDKAQCSAEFLSQLLREHIEKGDPVDVANLAMMLHQRGERII